jgi:hypothetical protein
MARNASIDLSILEHEVSIDPVKPKQSSYDEERTIAYQLKQLPSDQTFQSDMEGICLDQSRPSP